MATMEELNALQSQDRARIESSGGYGYEYGGQKNAAEGYANNFKAWGDQAQGRAAPKMNDGMLGRQGMRFQQEGLDFTKMAALGETPSVAQQQLNRGIADSAAANQAMANSTRGGAIAMAGAQRRAGNQNALVQAQGANQLGELRANEMSQARAQYLDQASQMRNLESQRALGMANVQFGQRGLNDAYANANYGREVGLNTMQLEANMRRYGAAQDFARSDAAMQAQGNQQAAGAFGGGLQMIGSNIPSGGMQSWDQYNASRGNGMQYGDEYNKSRGTGSQGSPGGDYMNTPGFQDSLKYWRKTDSEGRR